jgi:CRP-like cAMP-binding protein
MATPHKALPFIRTVPIGTSTHGAALSRRDRERLALIAVQMKVPANHLLFESGTPADAVYSISSGVVRSSSYDPHGNRHVVALLFAGDLVGLAQQGQYVNTAETITPATLFRVPLDQLTAMAQRDPAIAVALLRKTTESLRQAQRHASIVSRAYAPGRVAMFLSMQGETNTRAWRANRMCMTLPLSDLAEYVDLTTEVVAGAMAELESRAIIAQSPRGVIRILDRPRFDHLVAGGHL